VSLMRRFWRDFPVPSISTFRRELDRLFEDIFGEVIEEGEGIPTQWYPAVDVKEDDKAFYVTADLPGLKKEDINISLEGNRLTISGEREFSREEKKENYHFMERGYGKFTRSFTVPSTVDADKIKASYKDGVLTIELPKKEEVKPKKVEIT